MKTITNILLFISLGSILSVTTSVASEDMWTAWVDYNQDGNPIYLSRFEHDKWSTENFAPGQLFADNFSPCPEIDRAGNPWVIWTGRIEESPPEIY